MTEPELVMIIGAIAAPILGMWNVYQGARIKALELKYNNLCSKCVHIFTPKTEFQIDDN